MASEIEITLDGETLVLRPTLRAAKRVNEALGGFVGALRQLQNADLGAIALIIAAGTGKQSSNERERIEEKVYAAGVEKALPGTVKFVELLMRGGRDDVTDTGGQEGNG